MAFQGHVLMENRSGLVVGAVVTHADGMGERDRCFGLDLGTKAPRRMLSGARTTRPRIGAKKRDPHEPLDSAEVWSRELKHHNRPRGRWTEPQGRTLYPSARQLRSGWTTFR
jgi:hypothetical protein